MEELLNNKYEVQAVKSRIIAALPAINQIITNLLNQIDPALFDTVAEIERDIQNELNNLRESNTPSDSITPSLEEIDDFFRQFDYDYLQPTEKPATKGKKPNRAQFVPTGRPLSDSRWVSVSDSPQSLTPATSISSTSSQQNVNSLTIDGDYFELDRTALKKITQIKLNSQYQEDIATNYDLELEQFRNSCKNLDNFLAQLKMPKAGSIKTLTVNPETNRLAADLNIAIKNLISILPIDLSQANNIFECDGEPFPLYEVLTELYQLLYYNQN